MLGGQIDTSSITQEIAQRFKKEYGVESGVYGHALYWEVKLYAEALAKVGDPKNRLAISKSIGETNKEISSGQIKFDPQTHLAIQGNDFIPITFFQIWDGKRYLLTPKKYANGEFKLPPWMTK